MAVQTALVDGTILVATLGGIVALIDDGIVPQVVVGEIVDNYLTIMALPLEEV